MLAASARAFVFVPSLPTDVGFVHFDVADQLLELDVAQSNLNLVAHEQCGIVGTKTQACYAHGSEGMLFPTIEMTFFSSTKRKSVEALLSLW